MSLSVVLGKGPVGTALARRLRDAGGQVRVLSRSGGSPLDGVEARAVDASDPGALAAAARGADALYNCANPPYTRWEQEWPPVARALLAAAEQTGAGLVTMSNLYGYGRVDGPMTEDRPLRPAGRKGAVRARMWHDALAAHHAGRVRVTEARASDFVGPGVTGGSHVNRTLPRVLASRPALLVVPADQPHSWTSVEDVAATLAVLGSDVRAWGRAWHVPTAPPVTPREAVHGLCAAAGVDPVPVRVVPHAVLRVAGLAVPLVRELEEMRHSFTAPYVLDGSAVTRTFGLGATPLEQTWRDTVAWARGASATGTPARPAA